MGKRKKPPNEKRPAELTLIITLLTALVNLVAALVKLLDK